MSSYIENKTIIYNNYNSLNKIKQSMLGFDFVSYKTPSPPDLCPEKVNLLKFTLYFL